MEPATIALAVNTAISLGTKAWDYFAGKDAARDAKKQLESKKEGIMQGKVGIGLAFEGESEMADVRAGKHKEALGSCDCASKTGAKIRALFLKNAKTNWWMSEGQKNKYKENFPFLEGRVLSSVFSPETLDYIEEMNTNDKNNKWIILGSNSWIKGKDKAIKYAQENGLGSWIQRYIKKAGILKGSHLFSVSRRYLSKNGY